MAPTWFIRAAALAFVLGAASPALSASAHRSKTRTRTPTVAPTPARATTPEPSPRPATLVPEPAWVGTPAAGERPHDAILKAKKAGATDDELLARIAKEDVRYSLSTAEIQQLRAAGVSPRVIEAMLRAGRTPIATTPGTVSPVPRTAPGAAVPTAIPTAKTR